MAEKPVVSRFVDIESESVRIPLNTDEIQARFLAIDVEITARSSAVGTANFERYVPRIWSGYWYLLNNNSIKKYGAIEFKRQRIYEKEFPNLAYGMNNALFDGGVVFGLENEISDLKAWYTAADFLANDDNEANGLYLAHPLSEIIIYVPLGVDLKVKISHQEYPDIVDVEPSSNPITGLDGDSKTPNPTKPLESVNSDILGDIDTPPTLEDYVREKGYILSAECPNFLNTDLKERIDRTTADLQRVVNNLLLQGAINQSDIDAIKAINPSISNSDLIKALIDNGKITSSELDVAIERATLESYIPRPGKKAGWFVLAAYRGGNCSIVYDLYSIYGSPQSFIGLSPIAQNSPTVPDINWSTAQSTSALMFPAIVFQFPVSGSCGDVTDRFRVTTGTASSPEFFVQSRSQGTQKLFYRIQP